MDPKLIVLLVEDNPDDALLMQRAFQSHGVIRPPHVCRNGAEAISYLSGDGPYVDRKTYPYPHLIITDLKMPASSGFEVLQWIRQQPPLNRVIVVVFSASRHPHDIARAYDLHANSFLVKRSSVDQTAEMLRSMHNYWFCWNEKPNLQVVLSRLGT